MNHLITFTAALPNQRLKPNGSHGHWSVVSKAKKEARVAAKLIARANPLPEGAGAALELRVTAIPAKQGCGSAGYCPFDQDNGAAALKSFRDGLVDGWGLDDDREIITIYRRQRREADSPKFGTMIVEVWKR